jgi:hypothetical protein
MKEYIAFDSHKHYTLAEREDVRTGRCRQERIEHRPGGDPGLSVGLRAEDLGSRGGYGKRVLDCG